MDQPSEVPQVSEETKLSRRRLLKIAAATGGAVAASTLIPNKWVKPVVDVGLLPAHAQLSQRLRNLETAWLGQRCPECGDVIAYYLEVEFDYCPPDGLWCGEIEAVFSGGTAGNECVNGIDGGALSGTAVEPGDCMHYYGLWCVAFDQREKLTITVWMCVGSGEPDCDPPCVSISTTIDADSVPSPV